jgi:hypothetical protein
MKQGKGLLTGKIESSRGFIIMNEDGLYFAGLFKAKLVWSHKIEEAKPLYDEHKFHSMRRWCDNKELIMDYV